MCDLPVGEPELLRLAQTVREIDFRFLLEKLMELREEPAVDFREVKNILHSESCLKSVANVKDPFTPRRDEFLLYFLEIPCAVRIAGFLVLAVGAKSRATGLE